METSDYRKIVQWLRLCPGPHWWSLQRSPDLLVGGEGLEPHSRYRSFGPQSSALQASDSKTLTPLLFFYNLHTDYGIHTGCTWQCYM